MDFFFCFDDTFLSFFVPAPFSPKHLQVETTPGRVHLLPLMQPFVLPKLGVERAFLQPP